MSHEAPEWPRSNLGSFELGAPDPTFFQLVLVDFLLLSTILSPRTLLIRLKELMLTSLISYWKLWRRPGICMTTVLLKLLLLWNSFNKTVIFPLWVGICIGSSQFSLKTPNYQTEMPLDLFFNEICWTKLNKLWFFPFKTVDGSLVSKLCSRNFILG
jgi:hypothetical protein